MQQRKVDVAIIGGGTAGMVAYHEASKVTDSVVLIEEAVFGTTCARVGCMPSKLLIAAAEVAHQARHGGDFGIEAAPRIDGRAVMARVRRERDHFVQGVLDAIGRIPDDRRVMGHARFLADNRLLIDDRLELEAQRIVIATGSHPVVPGFLKAAGERLLTNDSVFELETLPASVAVFGPGAIGLELGQALSRLGVRVAVFGIGGSVGAIEDPEIRDYALRRFNEEFYLDPEAGIGEVTVSPDGVAVSYQHREKGGVTEQFDYVLAATGRRPNLESLALENTSLVLDERGIPRFDRFTLRCGESGIFIAGDVDNDAPVLHEATDEGHIAGRNAGAWPDVRAGHRRAPMAVVFTEPQIARAGLGPRAITERCAGCFAMGEVSFERQGRSRIMGRNRGLLRVFGEQGSGLFLGAEMFGPEAEHIGHLLAWAFQKRMTVNEMLEMPFYHPVVEEGVRTALRSLSHKLRLGPDIVEQCMDCGPGS